MTITTKLSEVLAQREALDRQLEELRMEEREPVIKELRLIIAQFQLTPTELFPDYKLAPRATPRRDPRQRPVMYRGDNGEVWGGGVGPRPKWIREAIKRGEDIERFRVA